MLLKRAVAHEKRREDEQTSNNTQTALASRIWMLAQSPVRHLEDVAVVSSLIARKRADE